MSDILERIGAYKREWVAARRAAQPLAVIESRARDASRPRGFRAALERSAQPGRLALIAEIKKASPSKGLIRENFDPAALACAYERGGAACLSVLTDGPSFQGDDFDLIGARTVTSLPCMRKDFMIDPWQILESRGLGADAILVILKLVDESLAADLLSEAMRLDMDALVETHDSAELARAAKLGAGMIGINNRDLNTFVTDLAVTERLAQEVPLSTLLVTESGILTAADAGRLERAGARAMLVGESLMRKADVEAATRALLRSAQPPT